MLINLPFSEKAAEIFQTAQNNAEKRSNSILVPEHMVEALLDRDDQVTIRIIEKCNINLTEFKKNITDYLLKMPIVTGESVSPVPDKSFLKYLQKIQKISKANGDEVITTDILFLAYSEYIYSNENNTINYKLPHQQIKTEIKKMRLGRKAVGSDPEANNNALIRFTRNITEEAINGKIDPVIGRDEEIRRTLQVLARRTKNNPVLIGEPGVGKTAIVEGLAQRIINNDIPETLKDSKVLALDLGSLLAGAKYRGELEERLKSVLY